MSSVLQPWVELAPWKCQSILLSGLRGPDHPSCPNVKAVTRWMRRVSQNNADASTDYMMDVSLPSKEAVEAECEFLPCHFVHHFADALRVIALWHQAVEIATYACELHTWLAVETFHFKPESDDEFVHRHRDKAGSIAGRT